MTQNTQYNDPQPKISAIAYKKRLNAWAIVRVLPDMQRVLVARFRSRSDADGHLQRLRQLSPDTDFMIVFDFQSDEALN
ncbi:MAG: hypothetical protein IGS49_27520 [Chlorogloeopsis fritschii C42_A2020_084]|jgi:hypothetical protein|uniref:hypothetical protein n=1 Tax=Chlorogloeopsis fritschii TaxID=1124 RepID=UPI001A0AF926|nr:hypothetical protein [Chlorogloeopsis fritschii]MBF2009091.1 hypothetical protein [Chlorogloeopsis fritschii C42_A2020_084]